MSAKKQLPEPLEALALILGTFAILFIAVLLFSSIQGPITDAENFKTGSRYFFIFGGLLFGLVPLLYAYWRRYDMRRLFRLNPVSWQVFFWSIAAALALSVIGDELDRLLNMLITVPDWLLESMRPLKAQSGGDWFLIISGAVIVAAVAEELLFRGFLQVALERKGDVTRAVILTSLTWTLIHQNPYWAVEIFIIGIFIGFLAWRTDSLIPPITVHMVNNLLAVIFLNMDLESSMDWYTWGDHVSPLLLVIAVGLLWWALREITMIYRRQ